MNDYSDQMPPLYPAPQIVTLNTEEGYIINPVTGDSIKPIINSFGDTVRTGVPVPAIGKAIQLDIVIKHKTAPAGEGKVVPANLHVYKIPEILTVVQVNEDSLKTFTPGEDTSSYVLINSMGDTVPTGVPILASGKNVPCIQPKPIKALPPRIKDNASISIKYLDEEQGMNSSYVLSILEDRHGNLWIGTEDRGVSRYNGITFTHFTEKEGLISNYVLSILEDRRGNLWFGTDEGVSMYNGETFTHYTEKEGLISNYVLSILEDRRGNLWIGTDEGVSMYNGETFTHYTEKEGLINNYVFSILEDSRGNLWFGTAGGRSGTAGGVSGTAGGVSMYNGESFTSFTEKDGLTGRGVRSIMEDRHGNLWFSTWEGLIMYNGNTFTYYTEREGLGRFVVQSMLEDMYGNLWFGHFRGGISMYDGENFTRFTENEGLSNNHVRSIMEDRHGNLWFGTAGGGANIYYGDRFTNVYEIESLPPLINTNVQFILEDSHDNLWFSIGHGMSIYNGASFKEFNMPFPTINNEVVSILEDSHGNFWFGHNRSGVSTYNGETFSYFLPGRGNNNYVSSILEDRNGNLWFGTWNGGVSMYHDETFTHFTEKEGLSNNYIYSIVEDSYGNLWFGTDGGGVSMYNGETFTHYTEKEGLISNYVLSILEDRRGNLWFCTDEGVSMYNGETFTHYTEKEGLINNYVLSILEDNDGNIWISTEKGINCLVFDWDSVSNTKHSFPASGVKDINIEFDRCNPLILAYSNQDGMSDIHFNHNSVILDRKNRIWWGSDKSLIMLDMNRFKIPYKPPSIQLNQIEINDQFLDYRRLNDHARKEIKFAGVARVNNYPFNLELKYNSNHLTFHFSAIDWSAPHKIRYSYKMVGLNNKWSNPTSDTKADYRSLPYGNYTFKVCAIGEAQKWSEPFEYTFTINPPWWHTWWARTGYGITVLLLIIGTVRWRTSILKQRQKELEKEVAKATQEIRTQKEEVESQRDEIETQKEEIEAQRDEVEAQRDQLKDNRDVLAVQKREIIDSITYAKNIQSALMPPEQYFHEILNDVFILFKPRDIVSGDFFWIKQVNQYVILAAADCTGHGVPGAFMSMLGMSYLNEIVHSREITQANQVLNELRKQIRNSLRQHGQAEESKDGIDMAVCVIDEKNNTLQYSGANNPLYLIRDNNGIPELTEFKADRMPLGYYPGKFKTFTNNDIQLEFGDVFYLFSDGFIDQKGGEEGKKFLSKNFKKLLLEIHEDPMQDQKQILDKTIIDWMGDNSQIDDILVIGIRA